MDKDLMEELGLMATDSQLDYIDTLLDQAGGVLEDYTDTPLEELSKHRKAKAEMEKYDDFYRSCFKYTTPTGTVMVP